MFSSHWNVIQWEKVISQLLWFVWIKSQAGNEHKWFSISVLIKGHQQSQWQMSHWQLFFTLSTFSDIELRTKETQLSNRWHIGSDESIYAIQLFTESKWNQIIIWQSTIHSILLTQCRSLQCRTFAWMLLLRQWALTDETFSWHWLSMGPLNSHLIDVSAIVCRSMGEHLDTKKCQLKLTSFAYPERAIQHCIISMLCIISMSNIQMNQTSASRWAQHQFHLA